VSRTLFVLVDHIEPGYVLLDVDFWGKFIPLTASPYLDLDEAIEQAADYRRAHGLTFSVMFSQAAIDAARRDQPAIDRERAERDARGPT